MTANPDQISTTQIEADQANSGSIETSQNCNNQTNNAEFSVDPVLLAWTFQYGEKPSTSRELSPELTKPLFQHSIPLNCCAPLSVTVGSQIEVNVRQIDDQTMAVQTSSPAWRARHLENGRKRLRVGTTAAEAAKLDLIRVNSELAAVADLCSKLRRQKVPLAAVDGPHLTVGPNRELSLDFGLALVSDSVITKHSHQMLGLKLMAFILQDDSLVNPTAHIASPSTLMEIITRPHQDAEKIPKITVLNLLTSLLPYQCESVSWCLRREGVTINENGSVEPLDASIRDYIVNPPLGWRKIPQLDLWASPYALRISSSDPMPRNTGSDDFEGKGLLAEEMGLGKTLEIMSLILLHPRPAASLERTVYAEHEVSDGSLVKRPLRPIKATLVIVPQSIAQQWVSELQLHAPSLKVMKMPRVTPSVDALAELDVLVVTYYQMSDLFYYTHTKKQRNFRHKRNPEIKTDCTLIDVQFWRVILDEVQMVHTGDSAAALTARRVPRVHAWAVSGTPVKSSLEDMRGITRFLDLQPFVERPCWQRMIASPADLDHTMRHVAIRHTKASVADQLRLTTQHRKLILLKFSLVERLRYDRLLGDAKHAAKSSNSNLSSWLLKLRQICSHTVSEAGAASGNVDSDSFALTLDQLLIQIADEADSELWTEQSKKINAELRLGQLYDKSYNMPRAITIWGNMLKEIENHISSMDSRLDAANEAQSNQKAKLNNLKASSEHIDYNDLPNSDASEAPNILDSEDGPQSEDQQQVDEALNQNITEAKRDLAVLANRVKVLKIRSRSLQELLHKACFFLGTGYFRSSQRLKMDLQSQGLESELQSEANQTILKENVEKEKYFYDRADQVRRGLLHEAELKVSEAVKKQKKIELTKVYKHCAIPQSQTVDRLTDIIKIVVKNVTDILEQPLIDENEAKNPEDLGAGVQSETDAYSKTLDLQAHAFIYLDFLQVLYRDRAAAINGSTVQPLPHFPPKDVPDGFKELTEKREEAVDSLGLQRTSLIAIMKMNQTPMKVRDTILGEIRRCQVQYTALRDIYNARVEYYRQLQNLSDQVKDLSSHLNDFNAQIVHEQRNINLLDISVARKLRNQTYIRNLEGSNHAASQRRSDDDNESTPVKSEADDLVNKALVNPCAICLDKIEDGAITSCGHIFCTQCIYPWLETRSNCPICKRSLLLSNVHKYTVDGANKSAAKSLTDEETENDSKKTDDEAYASELYIPISHRLYNHIHHIPLKHLHGIKIDMVVRHVLYLRSQDPTAQIVIFSQWAIMLQFLGYALEENKIKSCAFNSRLGNDVDRFRTNPEIACILLHSKAHVAGLTLVNANHVFLCEPLLNNALELQAISRINRIGQTRETFVWQFCVENTVEQTILGITSKSRLANIGNETEAESSTLAEAPLQFGTGNDKEAELDGNNKALRRILFKEAESSD